MKFGQVSDVNTIAFFLPKDHPDTVNVLQRSTINKPALNFHLGFAKWDRKYLGQFYPKGIGKKDLEYYSSVINCIEMNAFYYRIFPPEMVRRWYDRTSSNFTFCPKLPQVITQFRRLKDCDDKVAQFLNSINHFKEKLGMCFIQMHESFNPEKMDDLSTFISRWPDDAPLAIELRHTDWYNNPRIALKLYKLFEKSNITNIITDTPGRRDLMHMRLTSSSAFIRFTGANHSSDYKRLDDWVERIKEWTEMGLENLYFFIHQPNGHENMDAYNHFVKALRDTVGVEFPLTQPPKSIT